MNPSWLLRGPAARGMGVPPIGLQRETLAPPYVTPTCLNDANPKGIFEPLI